jgi:hypothetical protein
MVIPFFPWRKGVEGRNSPSFFPSGEKADEGRREFAQTLMVTEPPALSRKRARGTTTRLSS